MRRVGDKYEYDQPEQKAPYQWVTLAAILFMAFGLAVTLPLPWSPWITGGAVLLLCLGERIILRARL